jgi:hypothetical protein
MKLLAGQAAHDATAERLVPLGRKMPILSSSC